MTIISILSGDFEILMDDEKNMDGGTNAVAGMRTVRAAVATPTIVTTNALYSAIAEVTDDFIAMGFTNPMLPVTPNAYTMENKYFIPRNTTEFLREGAITANWSISASPDTNGNGVLKVAYVDSTPFVATDIGRQIIQADSTDSGTLLDFDVDPDGTLIAWIRPDDSTPTTGDIFDGTGAISVVADGGTGVSTSSTAGISGTTQYAAVQAIGSVPTATEVYLFQNRLKITDSTGGFQWWATDTAVSLGIISILIRTQDSGVLIADGDVEVFARRYTALYDNFRLNVAAGGFSALPLASSPDINNTTGYRLANCSAGTNLFNVGNAMYVGATFATATKKGVITAVGGTEADPDLQYYLIGDLTAFAGADSLKEFDFSTQLDGDATATVDAVAPNLLGPTDPAAGEGGTVTIVLGHNDVDHTGDGTTEPYSVTVDAQGDVPIAKVYERIKYVTRRGGDAADLFGAGVNVPGESYRGLDAVFEWDLGGTGFMTEGDDILSTTGGSTWTARLMGFSDGTTPTYISVTDQQTSVDSIINNDVVEDESADTVTIDSGGTVGIQNFTSPKSSPFGTFTGTQIFGARGVVFINITVDPQAYILTDDFGVLNSPPNTVNFTVSNTLALDRILVARDNGTDGIINKDQFGGLEAPAGSFNQEGNVTIRVAGAIDVEVPQSGFVRIVETTLRQEHHYVYDSRTISLGDFNLRTAGSFAGTADDTGGTTSPTLLNDDGQAFQTDLVLPGMLMQDTTNGTFYEIVSVDSESQCTIVQIFGTGGDFASGDGYEINKLIQLYATTDNVYDLILDLEATGSTVVNSFTKTVAANFDVVVNVRQGKIILPFTLNQLVEDGSTTVTVVRQPDTIAV